MISFEFISLDHQHIEVHYISGTVLSFTLIAVGVLIIQPMCVIEWHLISGTGQVVQLVTNIFGFFCINSTNLSFTPMTFEFVHG